VVPIPTLPAELITNFEALATPNSIPLPAGAYIAVPIPPLPIQKSVALPPPTLFKFKKPPEIPKLPPVTSNLLVGVAVPIPTLPVL
jgi:hypothetical protein